MSLRLAQANLYPQQQKTEMAFTYSSLLGVRLPKYQLHNRPLVAFRIGESGSVSEIGHVPLDV
jgi:hypothetical protein